MTSVRRATGPGRVNLIGEHTDYNLGLALPMAIGLGVTVEFAARETAGARAGATLQVRSASFPGDVNELDVGMPTDSVVTLEPSWLRLVAAMITVARPGSGSLRIEADLPMGVGLSSSAALLVALADVFGLGGSALEIASLCREAERRTGAPVGLMDPLACAAARAGHALLIDFSTTSMRQVRLPDDVEVWVVDSGRSRTVRTSPYAKRVAECEAAAAVIGPLGTADEHSIDRLDDPLLRRRARHVITECRRVREFAAALEAGDAVESGRLLDESHQSLSRDFEVSTREMDELVARLRSLDGVLGARMTGAGFGGCTVLLTRPGALDPSSLTQRAWRVEAVDGTLADAETGRRFTRQEEGSADG